MTTNVTIGYQSTYEIWDVNASPSAAYFEIGEVFNITPGESSADRIEATHMQSPGRRREYVTGMIDSGEASFEINWIPGNETDEFLRSMFESGATVNHRITFPNGERVVFEASIIGFSKAVPLDDRMTATITVSVSGAETWETESAPANTVLPAISGVAQVGEVLTAWPGVWTNSPAFTYVWEADGTPIAGATSSTYTPVVGQIGEVITVVVTGTNSAGNASAESVATAAVIAAE